MEYININMGPKLQNQSIYIYKINIKHSMQHFCYDTMYVSSAQSVDLQWIMNIEYHPPVLISADFGLLVLKIGIL